jgi:hypothetical protein
MSYVIVGAICLVVGFIGGVIFSVRKLADWLHATEKGYIKASGKVESFIEKVFLWIKGAL